jgi:predicted DNA-binding transcriptional regulator AlpA
MGKKVDIDDLIDANGVAEMLGLSHRNSVTTYQRRYPSMPRPAVNLPKSRIRLWLRSEIRQWLADREGK